MCIRDSIGAVLGFFVWNFPWGKIFLGDGGAYLLGFLAGLNGVLLVKNHPEVSAWFPLLLLIYPIWEVIFSILRRKFIQNKYPFEPDAIHLHTLIYRRIIRHKFSLLPNYLQNSLTSVYLWILQLIATIPALIFYYDRNFLVVFTLLFIVIYVWLYFRIVKFKTPKFLKF
jgi:UDP-N-acetylmuramyl pentapeptide phosphotransferase/UDP-N-acetylglucosamine-1-phosphate transferase